jgi:hypothetical protein
MAVRVDHVMESRDVMNIHVVEHSILNGIEYCTFWFRSVVENDSTPATITLSTLLIQASSFSALPQNLPRLPNKITYRTSRISLSYITHYTIAPEKRKGSPLPSEASIGEAVLPHKIARKTFSVITEGLSENPNTLRER